MNYYTVMINGSSIFEEDECMELIPCMELKRDLEKQNPNTNVTVDLVGKSSEFDFIDPT
jgi:hypothetical protein